MSTPAGFTQIIAANIQDATGAKLAAGTLNVQPTDANDRPIEATAGGAGGAILLPAAPFSISNGGIPPTSWVPDVSQTKPSGISYRFTIRDAAGQMVYVLRGVQPTGPAFNLDTFSPGTPLPLRTPGFNFRGAWAPNTPYALYDVLTYNGSTYTPTTPFISGSGFDPTYLTVIASKGDSGVVSGVQTAYAVTSRPLENVFAPQNVTMDAVLSTAGGVIAIVNDPRFFVSDFVPVREGGHFVCNVNMEQGESGYPALGYCFYDITRAFISGAIGVNAGVAVAVPTGDNIVFVRFSSSTGGADGSGVANCKVYLSATLPASTLDPLLGAVAVVGQANDANLFQPQGLATGSYINANPADPYFASIPVGIDSRFFLTNYFPVIPGGTLIANYAFEADGYNAGLVFFDQNKAPITGLVTAANAPITVPVNATSARASGFTGANVAATLQIFNGSTLPNGYAYPGLSVYTSNVLAALVGSKALAGKKWWHHGDSISAIYSGWEAAVIAATGMVQVMQDAITGRQTAGMFDTYGNDPVSGTFLHSRVTSIQNTWADGVSRWPQIEGDTLAQNLAAVAPDIITIYLGTNDGGFTPGTPGDATNAGTECGYVRNAIEAYLNVLPAARLMWIGPYKTTYTTSTNLATSNAIKGTCELYGVPYLDLDATSGVSATTFAAYLNGDNIHPNTSLGQPMLGRRIGNFINQLY